MKYIKSYSNYTLRKKVQNITEGAVYERDMSTLGGAVHDEDSGLPIYQSGNFKIVINDDDNRYKDISKTDYYGGDWHYADVENANNTDTNENEIVLKQDYFSLADFAYYGSLSDFVRTSINDIITRFPFEIYVTGQHINDLVIQENWGDNFYYCENPALLDLITAYTDDIDNQLHYVRAFPNNYELFEKGSYKEVITKIEVDPKKGCHKHGDEIATCVVNGTITIKVVKYFNSFILLSPNDGYSIRPKEKFINSFFGSLNSLQAVLLNRKTEPRYKASFEVYYETPDGRIGNKIEDFIFPISDGGYNLKTTEVAFESYVSKFLDTCSFYDERFCDNLYRMMTHEAIKNMDWTSKLSVDEYDEAVQGVDRMSHLIRLFGAQFDLFKSYIDGIKNYNNISYNDRANVPDYFLTDLLELDGWDVINIVPIQESKENTVQPYHKDNYYGVFNTCGCPDEKSPTSTSSTETDIYRITTENGITRVSKRVRSYTSNREYSYKEINNIFMKRLRMNSRNILRHKGTLEGIEMVFGLFGLRSKRFDEKNYDYEITEYIRKCEEKLVDKNIDKDKNCDTIYWYNNTRVNNNNKDVPYNGLPVRYIKNDKGGYDLYPYFDPSVKYDGGLYYQMYGEWYKKTLDTTKAVETAFDLVEIGEDNLVPNEIYKVKSDTKYFLLDNKIYHVYDDGNYEYINLPILNHSITVGSTKTVIDLHIYVSNPYGNCTDIGTNSKLRYYNLQALTNTPHIRAYILEENKIVVKTEISEKSKNLADTQDYHSGSTDSGQTKYFQITDPSKYDIFNSNPKFQNDGWTELPTPPTQIKNYFKGNNPHKGNLYDKGEAYFDYFKNIFKYAVDNEMFDRRQYLGCYDDKMKKIQDVGFEISSNTISDKIYVIDNKELTIEDSYKTLNTKNVTIEFNPRKPKIPDEWLEIIMSYVSQVIPSSTILTIKTS